LLWLQEVTRRSQETKTAVTGKSIDMDAELHIDIKGVLCQVVGILEALPGLRDEQSSTDRHQNALLELDGLLTACTTDIKAVCKHGHQCEGCFISREVTPGLAVYLKGVAEATLCATSQAAGSPTTLVTLCMVHQLPC
jgi:hypothetical protein